MMNDCGETDPKTSIETVKTLDELLAGVTLENRHDLIDFGEPVGKEIW